MKKKDLFEMMNDFCSHIHKTLNLILMAKVSIGHSLANNQKMMVKELLIPSFGIHR
jgi:hypothetical protein